MYCKINECCDARNIQVVSIIVCAWWAHPHKELYMHNSDGNFTVKCQLWNLAVSKHNIYIFVHTYAYLGYNKTTWFYCGGK